MSNWSKRLVRLSGIFSVPFLTFLAILAVYYPGYMTGDSVAQLYEGTIWHFTDWHPPMMAAWWGLLTRLSHGPSPVPLFLFHQITWGLAIAIITLTLFQKYRKRWLLLFPLITFMPPVFGTMGALWKDVGMGVTMMMGFAILFRFSFSRNRFLPILALPFFYYACGVRINAAPAVLPLCIWMAALYFKNGQRRRLWGVLLGSFVFVGIVAASFTTNKKLAPRSSYSVQQIFMHDLAYLSKVSHTNLFPAYLSDRPTFTLDKVISQYDPSLSGTLFFGDTNVLGVTYDPENFKSIQNYWWKGISQNPLGYVHHRWLVYQTLLGADANPVCFPIQTATLPNGFGFEFHHNWINLQVTHFLLSIENSILFRGWFWVASALLWLLWGAWSDKVHPEREAIFAISGSATLFSLFYFWIAPACDFRYFWWTVISICTCSFLFLAPGRRA